MAGGIGPVGGGEVADFGVDGAGGPGEIEDAADLAGDAAAVLGEAGDLGLEPDGVGGVVPRPPEAAIDGSGEFEGLFESGFEAGVVEGSAVGEAGEALFDGDEPIVGEEAAGDQIFVVEGDAGDPGGRIGRGARGRRGRDGPAGKGSGGG